MNTFSAFSATTAHRSQTDEATSVWPSKTEPREEAFFRRPLGRPLGHISQAQPPAGCCVADVFESQPSSSSYRVDSKEEDSSRKDSSRSVPIT